MDSMSILARIRMEKEDVYIDGLWSGERNWSSIAIPLSNWLSSRALSTIWRRYLPISGVAFWIAMGGGNESCEKVWQLKDAS